MSQDQPPAPQPASPAPAEPDGGFGYLLVLVGFGILMAVVLSLSLAGRGGSRTKDSGGTPSTWHTLPTSRTPSTGHSNPRSPEEVERDERARAGRFVTSTLQSLRTTAGTASLRNLRGSYDFSLLFGQYATDEQRAAVANEVKRLLADPDADTRLAAAEFVRVWPAGHPQLTAADADPVFRALLANASNAIRVSAAIALPSDPAATAVLLAILDDPKADADLVRRALAGTGGPLIDARDRLAQDRTRPVAIRIAAAAGQRVAAPGRALSARLLEKAVSDAAEDPAFRAFAAWHFTPDTPERFATAVQLMANDDAPKIVRRVLARRFRDHFAGNKRPPKEWVTDGLAALIACSSSAFRTPCVEPGFDSSGAPWSVQAESDHTSAVFHDVYTDVLAARGASVVPVLLAHLEHPFAGSRNFDTLAKLGPDAKTAVPELLAGFNPILDEAGTLESNLWYRIQAAKVFAAIGPDAKAAAGPVAKELVGYYHPESLPVLLTAVERTGGDRVAALVPVLTSEHGFPPKSDLFPRRKWAAEQLGKIGPDAKAAVPALAARIKADIAADVAPFVAAVAAIGPDALPELSELLAHAEPRVRIAAAYAIALIGPECRSKATPLLRRAIEAEKDSEAKRALLDALGAIHPTEAEKLGWQPRADARPTDVPIRVASANGRLELIRPSPPRPSFHFAPPPVVYLPRPPVPVVRPPVFRLPLRIR